MLFLYFIYVVTYGLNKFSESAENEIISTKHGNLVTMDKKMNWENVLMNKGQSLLTII